MKRVILPIMILAAAAGCDSEQDQPATPDYAQRENTKLTEPFKVLEKSRCFRIGKVGFNEVTPPEEIALYTIMKQGNAPAVLQSLYSKGSPSGKLYALLGLRFTNGVKYRELLQQQKQNMEKVVTQAGHIISEVTMKDIAELIEGGSYDSYVKAGMETH
ncbi:MAG: hypothetical protein JW947_05630 [Sedimentisphaerales bacterium]|nr:hypothetical protein [Sedimentisphaerales bacterium]